jgi:hypothetical protein
MCIYQYLQSGVGLMGKADIENVLMYLGRVPTFVFILFDDLELVSPWNQLAVLVPERQVNEFLS